MIPPTQRYQATDDRKRAIAAVARSLIVEKGFEGLRTREIADRVGINVATLHYHIPTKDALIELVAQSMKEDFMEQYDRYPREGLDPRQLLELEVDKHRDTRRDNPELLLVMEEMGRRARHDPVIARYIDPMRGYWRQQIIEILEAGVVDGSFRADLDPQGACYMVIGTMVAMSIYRLDDEASVTAARTALVNSILSDRTKAQSDV
jgi:AcrR family transcriptional regulator